VKKNGH